MGVRNILKWIRRQIVDDVPEGDALCEFDCRKTQCLEGEWEHCERRLQHAAGELLPEKKPEADLAAKSTAATPPVAPSPTAEPSPPNKPET